MSHAGLARARAVPVLDFLFLLYEEEGSWIGRSILTGHVSESGTPEGALRNLVSSIDHAILVACEHGHSAEDWYAAQEKDAPRFIRMFLEVVSDSPAAHEESQAPSGTFVLNAAIVRKRAA